MRILIVTDPKTPAIGDGVIADLAGTAERLGFPSLTVPVHDASLTKVLPAAGMLTGGEVGSMKPHELAASSLIEEFAPNVALIQTTAENQEKIEELTAHVLHGLLAAYSFHVGADERLHLKNLASRKIFKVDADDFSKIVNIIRSEAVNGCRISSTEVDGDSAVFDDLARAEICLRQYAAILPYRSSELRQNPKQTFTGALETVADEDIVLDDAIWIKGWIDWDQKAYSKLIVRIHDSEYEVYPDKFRADKYDRESCPNPMGFALLINLENLFSFNMLSVHVENSQGVRFEWLKRKIWISRDTEAHSVTPLVTGHARICEDDEIRLSIDCDGVSVDRILAWQGGLCVGRWEGEPASVHEEISFSIFPTGVPGQFIHLHAHLRDIGYVSWLRLSASAGKQVLSPEIDEFTVVENDCFELAVSGIEADFPIAITLDGKLIDVVSQPTTVPVDLSRCTGLATVQTTDQQGRTKSAQIWRHCRDAATGRALPVFVMPSGTDENVERTATTGKPRLLLIRQTTAPTDELYLLSALEKIGATRDYSLETVNLLDEDVGEEEMDRLLGEGVSVIISRYLTAPWIEAVSRNRTRLRDIFYIMDDDVTLAQNDVRMPGGYRKRMIGVAHSEFQTLLHLSTRFLVTSQFLLDRFKSNKTDLITPPYIRPAPSLDHLDDLSEIRIEYHGTQVHRVDLDAIASALVWIHDNYPNVKIRTYMGKFAPDRFRACKRIEIVPDIPWEDYKAAVAASPAHIALAPMLESPYNKGKSFVKVMDIARLGAVGLYTRRPPYSDVITHGVDGFLLENDASIWRYALAWLLDNPTEIKRMALAGQEMTEKLGNIDILADYWTRNIFSTVQNDEKPKSERSKGRRGNRSSSRKYKRKARVI